MNKLEALRCVETTSQHQAKNGTIRYYDPITKCNYLSYESGYIRRSYKVQDRWGFYESIYQLNPKRKINKTFTFSDGRVSVYDVWERVMISDPEDRMDLLARAVVNYREYTKKNNL